jgi:hypothetical protein
VFLTLVVIGLVGLLMMALPALGGHHHWPGHGPGHGAPTAAAIAHGAAHAHPSAPSGNAADKMTLVPGGHPNLRFVPSPRTVFSLCALYGAFGNALVHAAHLSTVSAALIAIVPAGAVEWTLVRPIWKLLFRFQADASSPLDQLICAEAQAVSPFRNGRGMIATVRDGRQVQLAACLIPQHAALPVKFGQRLRIEDVDARRERVVVSVIAADETAGQSIQAT